MHKRARECEIERAREIVRERKCVRERERDKLTGYLLLFIYVQISNLA